jgi:hypothetical protein
MPNAFGTGLSATPPKPNRLQAPFKIAPSFMGGGAVGNTGGIGEGGNREPSFRKRASGKTVEEKRLFLFAGSLLAGYESQFLLSSASGFSLFLRILL